MDRNKNEEALENLNLVYENTKPSQMIWVDKLEAWNIALNLLPPTAVKSSGFQLCKWFFCGAICNVENNYNADTKTHLEKWLLIKTLKDCQHTWVALARSTVLSIWYVLFLAEFQSVILWKLFSSKMWRVCGFHCGLLTHFLNPPLI